MPSIRIYIEGGGESEKMRRREFRVAFQSFFARLRGIARAKRMSLNVIMCGGRDEAYDDYKNGVASNTDEFCVLLVDSEEFPTSTPWRHVQNRDKWSPIGSDDHCQFFVTVMETWFVSDPDMLEDYYGSGFKRGKLPANSDLERVTKPDVYCGLESATKESQKGSYHKTRHAPDLIERLSEQRVRALSYADRLFTTIEQRL